MNKKGRLFVCGDIHGHQIGTGDARKLSKRNWYQARHLNKDDVLVVLGDFGHLWYTLGTNKEQEYNFIQ